MLDFVLKLVLLVVHAVIECVLLAVSEAVEYVFSKFLAIIVKLFKKPELRAKSKPKPEPKIKSRREKLVNRFKGNLEGKERILSEVRAVYRTLKADRSKTESQAGVLIATTNRIVFVTKSKGGILQQSFYYPGISGFEERKRHTISFLIAEERVSFYVLSKHRLDEFVKHVKERISTPRLFPDPFFNL